MEKLARKQENDYDAELRAAAKETHAAVINRAEYCEAMVESREQETWDNIRFLQTMLYFAIEQIAAYDSIESS